MSSLEDPRPGFADHDVVLHLLLGIVSGARRLDGLLPAPPAPPDVPPAAPALSEEEERRVSLLLGLVSVRRTMMKTLEPLRVAMATAPRTEPSASELRPPSLRELLR